MAIGMMVRCGYRSIPTFLFSHFFLLLNKKSCVRRHASCSNHPMHELPSFASQLEAIRSEIARAGEALVEWERLQLLCSDDMSVSKQFMCIAEVARAEKWSFAFLPNRSIRFAPMS